jgi:cytochrome c-type biogenesis protein CcmH/NrfG
MTDATAGSVTAAGPQPSHVYAMAIICLVAGLGIGFLMRSSQLAVPAAQVVNINSPHSSMPQGHPHSLEELKQISDRQAAPLLQKLKEHPNDTVLLTQVAAIYHTTHRFKEAANYYEKAVALEPSNVVFRTKLAVSLYRNGDVDGAIEQLNRALAANARDPNALFNLGMIKLQGKSDSKGALAAWRQLLRTNPDLSPDRKEAVKKAMADAVAMSSDQRLSAHMGGHDASN